ncbi:hypothetical protein QW71_34190 [Paenibacillus sp. IHB B 3415]|nr:hypothetical protein QW71_34190 [Paenibacillus sp. IHB B 3415]
MKREKLNVKAFSDNYTYKTALKEALINIYRIKGLLNQDVKYLIETERDVGKLDKWNKLALKENLTDEDVEIFARNLNVV